MQTSRISSESHAFGLYLTPASCKSPANPRSRGSKGTRGHPGDEKEYWPRSVITTDSWRHFRRARRTEETSAVYSHQGEYGMPTDRLGLQLNLLPLSLPPVHSSGLGDKMLKVITVETKLKRPLRFQLYSWHRTTNLT